MSDDLTCECNLDPSNPEQVEHCPQHGNVRLFAELLAEARARIAALEAGVVQMHWGARPEPEEVRVYPYGDVEDHCATCGERWPCVAAVLLAGGGVR